MSSALVRRVLVLLAVVLGLIGGNAPARAGTRVAVVGDDPAVVAALIKVLADHPEVGVIAVSASPVVGPDKAIALAIEHELDAVVAVRTSVTAATWKATVVAYQGRDGAELGRYEAQSAITGLAAAAAVPLWKKLGGGLNGALRPLPGATPPPPPPVRVPVKPPVIVTPPVTPPPTVTVTPAVGASGSTAPAGTATPTPPLPPVGTGEVKRPPSDPSIRVATAPDRFGPAGGPAIVVPVGPAPAPGPGRVTVGAALAPIHRSLKYTDDIRNAMRSHKLTVAAVALDATVRPLAGTPFEVTAALELSLGGSGRADDTAMKYTTKATEWSIGLGYHRKVGPLQATGRLGFGQQSFRIVDDSQPGAEQVPDVAYRWVRPGVDADVKLGARLHADLGFGWRFLTGTGDLFDAAWFPRGTGSGLDGEVGLRFRLRANLDLVGRFEARHYFFSMNPERGDPLIVGGAIDTYLGGTIGASYTAF